MAKSKEKHMTSIIFYTDELDRFMRAQRACNIRSFAAFVRAACEEKAKRVLK